MRPVERGPVPQTGGTPRSYAEYGDARDDLLGRLGEYYSYCEMCCHQGPAVEHVQPKSGHPGLALSWDNFLFGCPSCNSTKGHRPVVLSDFLWPDQDNTSRAFQYEVDRAPRIADGLTTVQRDLAGRTLELTGLDREPGHPMLSRKDRRWLKRREVWGIALESLRSLRRVPSEEMRRQILNTALGRGFWSVWMAVFADEPEMKRRFIAGFVGTARNCFDAEGRPIPRVGGRT